MKQGRRIISFTAVLALVVAIIEPFTAICANAASSKVRFDSVTYTLPSQWSENSALDGKLPAKWYPDKKAKNKTEKSYYGGGSDILDSAVLIMQSKSHADSYSIKKHKKDITNAVAKHFSGSSSNVKNTKVAGYYAFTFDVKGELYDDYFNETDPMYIRMAVIQNTSTKRVDIIYAWADKNSDLLKGVDKIIKSATKKKIKTTSNKKALSEGKFEEELNAGKNVYGKSVKFKVKDIDFNSPYGTCALIAGHHLNFVSDNLPNVTLGSVVTVKVTGTYKYLGDWVITYERV